MALGILVSLLGAMAPGSAVGVPQEGLSRAERQAALAAMSPEERRVRYEQFTTDRYAVVAYQRVVQSFDSETGYPVGEPRALDLGNAEPMAVTGITNLEISISVVFDYESACCRWDIMDWFNWTGTPPNQPGLGKDQLGTAWAHGLALRSDTAYGVYTHNGGTVPMNRNDMSPNVGTSWEFNECKSTCYWYADWGYMYASIYWPTRRYEPTNVVYKYFHTYGDFNYTILLTATPGVAISPTNNQTSTAVYATFTD